MKGMFDYILESSGAMLDIIIHQDKILEEAFSYLKDKEISEVILFGSGTSFHAALSAKDCMQEAMQRRVSVFDPVAFSDHEDIFSEHALAAGISQGGRSASTIEALDHAKAMGMYTAALSAERDTPISSHADVFLPLYISEENTGPKTKGYFASVCELCLLAMRLGLYQGTLEENRYRDMLERLQASVSNIRDIAVQADIWYQQRRDKLKPYRRIYVLGYGPCIGAAREGALKILEGMCGSVYGYEAEEFMHGIYHAMDDGCLVIGLAVPGRHRARLIRLMYYLQDVKEVYGVCVSDEAINGIDTFVFPFCNDPGFASIEYIVFLQVIAVLLSKDQGYDCDIPSDPDFHRIMESYLY